MMRGSLPLMNPDENFPRLLFLVTMNTYLDFFPCEKDRWLTDKALYVKNG